MDVALRFLSHRSRSEAEVRRRLGREFPESVVETTLAHLKDRGLLDDAAFAQSWRESRERNRPRSRMVLQRELYQRGVSRTVANEALEDLDEEANAMSAGTKGDAEMERVGLPKFSLQDDRPSQAAGLQLWTGIQDRGSVVDRAIGLG